MVYFFMLFSRELQSLEKRKIIKLTHIYKTAPFIQRNIFTIDTIDSLLLLFKKIFVKVIF